MGERGWRRGLYLWMGRTGPHGHRGQATVLRRVDHRVVGVEVERQVGLGLLHLGGGVGGGDLPRGGGRPELGVGVEHPVGVGGGGAGVGHGDGARGRGGRRGLVVVGGGGDGDGEGAEAGEPSTVLGGGDRGRGGAGLLHPQLLVGIVWILQQGLEPQHDLGAREPDGASGEGFVSDSSS